MALDYATLNLDSVLGPIKTQTDNASMLIVAMRRAAFDGWKRTTKPEDRKVIVDGKKYRLTPLESSEASS